MTLKMMTWNIKTGGGDRLPAIAAVVERERPDILTMQELRGFDRHGGARMRDFAATVGMEPFLSRSLFGQPVAVLVRPPLRIDRRQAVTWRMHHAAAMVTVPSPAGELTVVSTHLNPFSPPKRYREAVWLAHRFRRSDGRLLIAGDLNGLDPGTDHTETLAAQPAMFRRRHTDGAGAVDTRGLQAFQDAGLVDLWKTAGTGTPLTVPTTRGGGREFSRMRLDYVLAGPALAKHAVNAWVVRGDETEYASDHYPLRVDLDV